jgi:hypothetical protein
MTRSVMEGIPQISLGTRIQMMRMTHDIREGVLST